jgi:hypothetical protein
MNRRMTGAGGALVLMALAGPALANPLPPGWRALEGAKAFPMLDKYLSAKPEERSLFAPRYCFKVAKPMSEPARYTLRTPTSEAPLPLDPTGCLTGPLTAPKSITISMEFAATLAPSMRYDRQRLQATIDQANRGIRKAAGFLSFAVPKLRSVHFHLPDDAASAKGWAITRAGQRIALASASKEKGGGLRFAVEKAPKDVIAVELERAPKAILLDE